MKQGVHPEYTMSNISCACGATYKVRSTKPIRKLEICSACHPFFTGKNKLIDAAGRVDKFNQRYKKFAKPEAGAPDATESAETSA